MRTRPGLLAVPAVLVAMTALCMTPSPAATAADAPSARSSAQITDAHQVTLVTGERIKVDEYSDGTLAGTVLPGDDGVAANIATLQLGKDLYAIPESAQPYIAADRLDRELFNLTKLIAFGYDDEHRTSTPLIATYGAGAGDETAAPEGSVVKTSLPSIDGVALGASKKQARTFWEAVDDDRTKTASTRPVLADGIKKIWLDKPVKVALDKSVPQIGAPEAWAKGFDGKGVKVAVLDTGIDATHPDVADRIKGTKNFTTDPDAVDHHGHGTHVAATVAGSGAASGGKNKGVAPAADLYIGKVLNDKGSGSDSEIIAGMQWAVDQGADIVSMSLGSSEAGDGTDPMSQAVNDLTASSGTLFVIAAGNSGPGDTTVGAPGAADSALTVGAVDKSDKLASFSSRGPRRDDFAVKPEITAPGVGIVAARAAGTTLGTPVDANYTALNGTSMATPHVAGAAAILKQRHPDWDADHLKQVMVGTAKPGAYTAYEQGGGRVDVPRTLDATLYSSPAVVSAGVVSSNGSPVTKKVTYTNSGDTARTVNLGLSASGPFGGAVPAGTFQLGSDRLTVPAGGTAETTVTVNPQTVDGAVTARITATADSGEVTRTTVGATMQPPGFDLTVKAIDRRGDPSHLGQYAWVYNGETGFFREISLFRSSYTMRVPAGRYFVMGLVQTPDSGGLLAGSLTLAGSPEVAVDGPATVTLDAREGRKIDVRTPKVSEAHGFKLGFMYLPKGGPGLQVMFGMGGTGVDEAYAVPTPEVTEGAFDLIYSSRRYAPIIRASYQDGTPLPLMRGSFTANYDGHTKLRAVNTGAAGPAELEGLDLRGKLAVIQRTAGVKMIDQVDAVAAKGATAAVMLSYTPGPFVAPFSPGTTPIPVYGLGADTGRTLVDAIAAGESRIELRGVAASPYVYNVAYRHQGSVPQDPHVDVTRENSAVYKADYPTASDGTPVGDTQPAFWPYTPGSIDVVDWFTAPLSREEWYSVGDGPDEFSQVRWIHSYCPDVTKIVHTLNDGLRYHARGERVSTTWLAPGNGPASAEYATAFREGDRFGLSIRDMGDTDPTHSGVYQATGDTARSRLYRGDELLADQSRFLNTSVPVGAGRDRYRLTIDTSHGPWFPLSTTTSTTWGFESARPSEGSESLPLLWPRFDFGTDEHNTRRGGVTGLFGLRIVPQAGASIGRLTDVEVSASSDDGATWKKLPLDREHGSYQARVRNPETGFVSVRVRAEDSHGNTVEQTLIRAYAVR